MLPVKWQTAAAVRLGFAAVGQPGCAPVTSADAVVTFERPVVVTPAGPGPTPELELDSMFVAKFAAELVVGSLVVAAVVTAAKIVGFAAATVVDFVVNSVVAAVAAAAFVAADFVLVGFVVALTVVSVGESRYSVVGSRVRNPDSIDFAVKKI